MTWPHSQDYNEAIQSPAACFDDAELKQGEAVTNTLGLPSPCSGNFADVYAVQCATNKWAVKCFTREIAGLKERYREISIYLKQNPLPFMVDFAYLDKGIRVRGQWYPILKMRWVDGVTLNEFVAKNLDKPQVLDVLSQIWLKLAARLREAQIAHCDLQHGNVLLVPGSKATSLAVKLVDYDGMCVPSLTLLKSAEAGHPSFQHPRRAKEGVYNLEVDRFSHLVVYTALRCLVSGGRKLWEKYDNGDNLLFRQRDFDSSTTSELFGELLKSSDPHTKKLVVALVSACNKSMDQTPLLEDFTPKAPKPLPVAVASLPSASGRRKRKVPIMFGLTAAVGALILAGGSLIVSGNKTETPKNSEVVSVGSGFVPDEAGPPPKAKPKPVVQPKQEPKPTPKSEPVISKTAPVPDDDVQGKALKEIKDIFKDEYSRKKTSDQAAFALKLLEQGLETKDDPVVCYVLIKEAVDLSARAGDLPTTIKAIEELSKRYEVRSAALKAEALEKVLAASNTRAVVDTAIATIQEATDAADFVAAEQLVKVAIDSARKLKNFSLIATAQNRGKEVAALKEQFDKVKDAIAKLKDSPDDGEANLVVGKYNCFLLGDWSTGLSMLAKSSDDKYKTLASKDLENPAGAEDQVKIADGWWDIAESEQGRSKLNIQKRAYKWYDGSVSTLTGLTKTKVQKRMTELEKLFPQETVDLLKLIDPDKHAVVGKWQKNGDKLSAAIQPNVAVRLQIPYAPGEEYTLKVRAERKQGIEMIGIGLALPKDNRQVLVCCDGWGGATSSIEVVDGKTPPADKDVRKGKVMTPNQPVDLVLTVRKQGITMTVNGRPHLSWAGDYSRLSVHQFWAVPEKRALFIVLNQSMFEISKLEYIPITGKGKNLE